MQRGRKLLTNTKSSVPIFYIAYSLKCVSTQIPQIHFNFRNIVEGTEDIVFKISTSMHRTFSTYQIKYNSLRSNWGNENG